MLGLNSQIWAESDNNLISESVSLLVSRGLLDKNLRLGLSDKNLRLDYNALQNVEF